MGSEIRLWKWLLVVGLVGLAILALYPPKDRLKPGIDLAGGSVLVYEIDTAGLEEWEKQGLADRVMEILKARVDPNSQFNLVWRPIGNNRLEIQLPRPPKEAKERRDRYEAALDKVRALNVPRVALEQALSLSGAAREAALKELERGVSGRMTASELAATKWDAYLAVRGSGDVAAEVPAQSDYQSALEAVMDTNLPLPRLTDVLSLAGDERTAELEKLRTEYPAYASAIEEVQSTYDAWNRRRGSLEDPADLKRLLRGAGVLEFRVLAERDPADPSMLVEPGESGMRESVTKYATQLQKRGPRPKSGDRYMWYPIEDYVKFMQSTSLEDALARKERSSVVTEQYAGKWYVLAHVDFGDQRYGLTTESPKWALKRAYPSRDPGTGSPTVDFVLDPRGGAQFANVTRLNLKRELAIFLDGVATSHATINSTIGQHGQITGGFTDERVREIVQKLEAGSLPARLKETPLQEKVIGPSLGEQNREMGLRAATYSVIFVLVFMAGYYLINGVVADIAVLINLLFVLAVMALLEATFTLPGIAGLALTVAMAVDANVLVNERIREERQRGVALKKAVKLGYEKALSAIVDSNLTTLITCVILGYVGSEEVKGFAMTLGFGIVISMFTSLFVTRLLLMTLIEWNIVKSLPMVQMVPPARIDWIGLKRLFWALSTVCVVGGLGYFVYIAATDKEAIYDIEFLGGTSVQVELADGSDMKLEDVQAALTGAGTGDGPSVPKWLREAGEAMRSAQVAAVPSAVGEFTVTSDKLKPAEIDALLRTTFENKLAMGGFTGSGSTARFVTREAEVASEEDDKPASSRVITLEEFQNGVLAAADYAIKAADRLMGARVQTVASTEAVKKVEAYELVTVEPQKDLVRAAILATLGDKLKVERSIEYKLVTSPERAPDGLFPILEDHSYLGQVIGGDSPFDVREHKGGVAMVFDRLNPPQTIAELTERLKEIRLQPQFQKYESRGYNVVGLAEAGRTPEGEPQFSRVALVVSDESLAYSDDPEQWEARMAKPELQQAAEALSSQESLRKVVQFAPQVAKQAQQRALIALVLSLGAIVAYVWIRFGTMQYGLAAIVALFHDVAITLGVITIADKLGLGEFRIDMSMIAALLTVVGYSLNDKIVVFDRIRETRGKLKTLTDNIINSSINMTLSRTVLTGVCTLMALFFLLWMGGPGVAGFSLAMLCGIIGGTYSSVAIAAPLLQDRKLLHLVVYAMIAVIVVGITATSVESRTFIAVVAGLMLVLLAIAVRIEQRMDYPAGAAATA